MTRRHGDTPFRTALIDALRRDPPWIAPPIDAPRATAAIGVVVHTATDDPALLFIERARREGDFWSGDMAFPGGRSEPNDSDLEATARREIQEELALSLEPPIGRIDDFDSRVHHRNYQLVVAGFVYEVAERPPLTLSDEVAQALWIPLSHLVAPESRLRHERPVGSAIQRVPAVAFDERIIWGMTYRMLATLTRRLGFELPAA